MWVLGLAFPGLCSWLHRLPFTMNLPRFTTSRSPFMSNRSRLLLRPAITAIGGREPGKSGSGEKGAGTSASGASTTGGGVAGMTMKMIELGEYARSDNAS